jgi:hypothetical protein
VLFLFRADTISRSSCWCWQLTGPQIISFRSTGQTFPQEWSSPQNSPEMSSTFVERKSSSSCSQKLATFPIRSTDLLACFVSYSEHNKKHTKILRNILYILASMYGAHSCQGDVQVLQQNFWIDFSYRSKLQFPRKILKGSDDGVWHLELLGFSTVSIVRLYKNTTFRKLDLFPSSGVRGNAHSVGTLRKMVRWLRVALSRGPNRVCISPHTW